MVYRPPSEARSLIVQATLACPHNKCAFCSMYKDRKFRVRPIEQIIEDFDLAVAAHGAERVRTIFLADGNTAVLPADKLITIGEAAQQRSPRLDRIPIHVAANFLLRKSLDVWPRTAVPSL